MISLYLSIKPYSNGSPLLSSQQEMLLREFHSYLIQKYFAINLAKSLNAFIFIMYAFIKYQK